MSIRDIVAILIVLLTVWAAPPWTVVALTAAAGAGLGAAGH